MSIPERFLRIARHKLTEFKERIDRLDEEDFAEEDRKRRREEQQQDAKRELNDSLEAPRAFPGDTKAPPVTPSGSGRLRTPQEIMGGSRSPSGVPMTGNTATMTNAPDPLLPYYKLLNLEPGADFVEVTAAYNNYAARSDPSRFPAGSEEEKIASALRDRLDTAYRALRDALDPTARRFDLLEFDKPVAEPTPKSPS